MKYNIELNDRERTLLIGALELKITITHLNLDKTEELEKLMYKIAKLQNFLQTQPKTLKTMNIKGV